MICKIFGKPNDRIGSLCSDDNFDRRISNASAMGVETTPPFGHPSLERRGVISQSYLYDGFQVISENTAGNVRIKRSFVYADMYINRGRDDAGNGTWG